MTRKMEQSIMLTIMSILLLASTIASPTGVVLHRADASGSFLANGDYNESISKAVSPQAGPPPPSGGWILLATDADEGSGTSLKTVYGQLYSDIIYLKVEHHRSWTTISDIDTAIFMDADRNPATGLPDGHYPGQNAGIGADYIIIVGFEATAMWRWDPNTSWWDTANTISLAYLDAPDYSNVFVVGVYRADMQTVGIIDGTVSDVPSGWDWMPNSGHFTFALMEAGPGIVVMIGDAAAHSAPSGVTLGIFSSAYGGDPGRDEVMFTSDDLDYVPVIQLVASQGISVFTIDYTYSGDAYNNFDYISTETGGLHYSGGTGWETAVANEIQARLGSFGDVVFIYDLSGSMSDDLSSVKAKTQAIIDVLPTSSNFAFGVGTIVDYPHGYDSYGYAGTYGSPPDYAWQRNLDVTTDRALAKNTIDMLAPFDGMDWPQNYVRALYEAMFFSWRFTGTHDVSITDIKPLKTAIGQGYKTGVNVTVAYYGSYQETFNASLWAQPAGLVGCWEFDEGAGTTAYDSSGNNNHGTIYGSTWTDGKIGEGLYFTKLSDYVEVADSSSLDLTNQLTISAWIKPHDLPEHEVKIVGKGYSSTYAYWLGFWPGSIILTVENSLGYCEAYYPFAFVLDEWTHIAATWNRGVTCIYINGVLQNTNPPRIYTGILTPNEYPLIIGSRDNAYNDYFNGTIDEIKIYNRALSAEQIWAEYTFAPTLIETQTVTLESGQTTSLTFTWNTSGWAKGDYTLTATVDTVLGETDTADNTRTYDLVHIGIPGDVNGDKKVDLKDVYAVGRAFGSVYNSTDGWYWHTPRRDGCPHDPNCDINWDWKIDLRDYYTTCRNFGKEEP